MFLKVLRPDLLAYLKSRGLLNKWQKAVLLFEANIKHPSLNVELLEPKWHGIYSFRIDRKYRALFFLDGEQAEVFQITNHYK
jgi:Txe/YoeB family toxin of Txe-Axe toxin-antitoxin module